MSQGLANVVTGFFGGMGGCAMIGQSMINIKSGARMRISGILAALFLLIFILFASSLIEQIPIAALVGVMFVVVVGTFSWASLRIIRKVPLSDAIVMIIVLAQRYDKAGTRLHLLNLSENCKDMLHKAKVISTANVPKDRSHRVSVSDLGTAD